MTHREQLECGSHGVGALVPLNPYFSTALGMSYVGSSDAGDGWEWASCKALDKSWEVGGTATLLPSVPELLTSNHAKKLVGGVTARQEEELSQLKDEEVGLLLS